MTRPGLRVFRVLMVVIALALIHRVVIAPARCAHAIRPIDQRTSFALSGKSVFERTRIATANLAQLDAACPGCYTDVDLFLLRAANHGILGRREQALLELEKGLRIDNRPELYLRRAEILMEMGRLEAAVADYALVGRFGPLLIETLDPTLRARIDAEIAKSPRHERP